MDIIHIDGTDKDFVRLCGELDDFLNELAGGEENRMEYVAHNTLEDIHDAFVVYQDGAAVACASFKKHGPGVAEVKRVFVRPEYRGRNMAVAMMQALEKQAAAQGYTALVLETGNELARAKRLYEKLGYKTIPNYAPYVGMPQSVCMGKTVLKE